MIKIVATMKVSADKLDAFKEVAAELVQKSSAEEGNISYTLNQSINDPQTLAFIEMWEDQKSIDAHNGSEHFRRIIPLMNDLREGAPTVTLYTEIQL